MYLTHTRVRPLLLAVRLREQEAYSESLRAQLEDVVRARDGLECPSVSTA